MSMTGAQLAQLPTLPKELANKRSQIMRNAARRVEAMINPHRPMSPVSWFALYAEQYELVIAQAQAELVILAAAGIDMQLMEQSFTGAKALTADPGGFVGATGDGRSVMGAAYAQMTKIAVLQDADAAPAVMARAWSRASTGLMVATQTVLSDTSRLAKKVQMTARPGTGWIRMATPPCCSRCAILAGKKASGPWVGFQRHPSCDCDTVPVAHYRERHDDPQIKNMVFDTREYFLSLPESEQDRIFTKAGAQAIRDGADPAQVVNARRGMTTAVDKFGRKTKITTEGTTKKGWAYQYLRTQYNASLEKKPGARYRRATRPRLSPEAIYEIAGSDSDMALNLLHKNGYLTDASANLKSQWSWAIRDKDVRDAQDRTFEKLLTT